MTIPALAPLLIGALEPFADALTLTDPGGSHAGTDLLDAPFLSDRLARLAPRYRGGDRRAVASIWSKHHFSRLIPAALAASLMLDLDLPIGLANVRIVADAEGRTRALVLRHEGKSLRAPDAQHRFAVLVDEHLEPLVAVLAAVSGASPRVFWSNAGNVFDFVVRGADEIGAGDRPGVAQGLALMAERHRGKRVNPLYAPMAHAPDGSRTRRVCCIRYLAPGTGYCGTCPITPERRHDSRPAH